MKPELWTCSTAAGAPKVCVVAGHAWSMLRGKCCCACKVMPATINGKSGRNGGGPAGDMRMNNCLAQPSDCAGASSSDFENSAKHAVQLCP